jgi:hypothetical protein
MDDYSSEDEILILLCHFMFWYLGSIPSCTYNKHVLFIQFYMEVRI